MYQVFEISSKYFEYQVATRVYQDIEDEITAPEISLCFRYVDIFDRRAFSIKTGKHFHRPVKEDEISTFQSSVTVRDIFKFTPYEFNSLEDCTFADDKFRRIRLDGVNCYKKFHVSRFYTQEFICYHFKFGVSQVSQSLNTSFLYDRLSYSINEPGMMFSLDLNKTLFEPVDTMKVIISQRSYPFRSRAFSPVISRHYDVNNNNASYDLIKVCYSLIKISRLESPYETQCVETKKKFLLSEICKQKCLIGKVTSILNRIPYSTVITKPVNLKHVNPRDLNASDFVNKLVDIEYFCAKRCNYSSCEEIYTRTEISKEDVTPNDEFRFVIESPRSPAVTIKYNPKIILSEYLLYISTTVGIWFGVSAIHLNPVSSNVHIVLLSIGSYFNWTLLQNLHQREHSKRPRVNSHPQLNSNSSYLFRKVKKQSQGYSNSCLYCLETRLMLRSINIELLSLRAAVNNCL